MIQKVPIKTEVSIEHPRPLNWLHSLHMIEKNCSLNEAIENMSVKFADNDKFNISISRF